MRIPILVVAAVYRARMGGPKYNNGDQILVDTIKQRLIIFLSEEHFTHLKSLPTSLILCFGDFRHGPDSLMAAFRWGDPISPAVRRAKVCRLRRARLIKFALVPRYNEETKVLDQKRHGSHKMTQFGCARIDFGFKQVD